MGRRVRRFLMRRDGSCFMISRFTYSLGCCSAMLGCRDACLPYGSKRVVGVWGLGWFAFPFAAVRYGNVCISVPGSLEARHLLNQGFFSALPLPGSSLWLLGSLLNSSSPPAKCPTLKGVPPGGR